ncbi:Sodium/hydrogen exchanger 9B2, partial [Kappamyces sp. JEL0680]
MNLRHALSLVVVVTAGLLGGNMALAAGQDTMIGMLAGGIVVRNVFPFLLTPIPHSWTSILWTLALCSVICRAGLSLQKYKVVPHLYEAVLLGSLPLLCEAVVTAFVARMMFGVPTPWAYALAFGVASISPGVVVPLVLKLIDNGWQRSRLPPLMLTALGLDVLVGTAGFGIALASCFGHKHEHHNDFLHDTWMGRGVEEIGIGLLLGL